MSLNDLFRKEAALHQRARLWGDVILTQPVSYFFIAALFGIIILAAGLFLVSQNYARKESVAGYLVPDSGIARVYADQGGVLEEIYAEAGDKVTKGQAIAKVKLERLSFGGESSQDEVKRSLERELQGLERRLQETALQERQEQLSLKARIEGVAAEKQALENEKHLLLERIALADKQYKAALDLAQKGYAAERLVDERQGVLLSARQAVSANERQIVSLKNTIAELNGSLDLQKFRFAEQRANLTSAKEGRLQTLANLKLGQGYTISAPVDGVVSSLLASAGTSLRPNLPVASIRPEGTQLEAQLLVPGRAIGLIEKGQEAKIQYDAFPYQRFGIFSGYVTSVSETILTPADLPTPIPLQEAFYLVKVQLDSQTVSVKGSDVPLKAGMVLKADITLENRTLIEWVLDPIFSISGKL